jgi:two-component system chemotaxis sensor kinase CheA
MSAELDMSQYLALFLQEGEEQLEILEQELIKLEQDPSTERMQVIFRAAHTLKGSSRAMDFQSMAELTHEMESVLDGLRQMSRLPL